LRGEPAFYEGAYRSRSGRQLYLSVQYAPLRDDRGSIIGGIGVLEDISQRVLGEKQLRAQAAEMERVNAALRERTLELEAAMQARSRLYSAMNHELRTPISAIMLYQELLIAESLGPLTDEQVRALEHSHTATRHLLDLVRDILDLGKIEAGKVSVQPVEVRLGALLAELQASMSPLTESYGSPLHLDVARDLEPVITDPQRLRQILMNFLSNAAKYGRQNPIRLRCIRRSNGEVVIEVVDRGIGIADNDLQHVFEDFVQLGPPNEEGTGLGLAISRRLADLLGARLEVESVLGAGSAFRVVLPSSIPPALVGV
jgi:signal transduction histidine kinase